MAFNKNLEVKAGKTLYGLDISLIADSHILQAKGSGRGVDICYLKEFGTSGRFCKDSLKGMRLVDEFGFLLNEQEAEERNSEIKENDIPIYKARILVTKDLPAINRLVHMLGRKEDSQTEKRLVKLIYERENKKYFQSLHTKQGRLYVALNEFNPAQIF